MNVDNKEEPERSNSLLTIINCLVDAGYEIYYGTILWITTLYRTVKMQSTPPFTSLLSTKKFGKKNSRFFDRSLPENIHDLAIRAP
ncbi:expressed protein [Echinococcus multilocularis]|uniref:Expressed protein n=1 Tax=Echinococcus multilocularis TaxID=6211 RepID=A0A068YAY2_ECHMU|nr:expressed protein [Echinococcus multilocularis]